MAKQSNTNVKGQLANGTTFALREPTLNDLAAIEETAIAQGKQAHELGTIEISLLMFSLICEKFGDADGVTREELGTLSSKNLKGVLSAMDSFRDDD